MRWIFVLASAVASVSSLAAVFVDPAPAASPANGTIVRVDLKLKADHGFRARLETSDKEIATLTLERKNRLVTYEVHSEVDEQGLRVRFGRLGAIDVAFVPTRTLDETEPSDGCKGEPRTLREGVFTGKIDFTGERGYARIAGFQTEGSMSVISRWECPEDEELAPIAKISRHLARSGRANSKAASLIAASRRCSCFFGAGVHHGKKRGSSVFFVSRSESREGMEIARVISASAGPAAFVYDHEAGTAALRPPRPFSGRATYRHRPHARDLWRSTIRAPLPGARPLRLGGPGFRASLYPEYIFD